MKSVASTFEIQGVQIARLQCLPGSSAGLRDKTALLTLTLDATVPWTGLPVEPLLQSLAELPTDDNAPVDQVGALTDDMALSKTDPRPTSAHVLGALVVRLQRQAYDPLRQGRVLVCQGNSLTLALPWLRESVLRDALRWAVQWWLLAFQATAPEMRAAWQSGFAAWLDSARKGGLPPNTQRLVWAAWRRDIPVTLRPGFVQLGWGRQAERIDSSFTGHTSNIATRIARNKALTKQLLASAHLPVPAGGLASKPEEAVALAHKLGWPVVVKPANQDQGTAVVAGIRDERLLRQAFTQAATFSPGVIIVEQHIEGDDHRLLVVGGRLRVATRRTPGGVWGDGVQTVSSLLAGLNADPRRGRGKRCLLINIDLDEEALGCLADQDLQADSVVPQGQFVRLRRTANISTGGTANDVTAIIHPDNRALAERAARAVGLDIAGVDFLCPDIARSWRDVGGAICEVNAQPGFRVHWLGDPKRDLNGEIVEWLFQGRPARIPTVAISGTNGKSTVARMLHHLWQMAGKVAGVCTTNGVWVGEERISDQNLSGCPGARLLLEDPMVEVAVIEMPRKGLITLGHPCDHYDVAALLNVQDDHIGVDGIESLAEMARLKAQVLARATKAVVVNAEDPLCLAMRARAGTPRHLLVARDGAVPALQAHLAEGGEAVFVQLYQAQRWIVLVRGSTTTPLLPLAEIPATMNGLLHFNESNALFAVALAWAQGLEPEVMRAGLASFGATLEHNPGRYNLLPGLPFQVLLDYGHNPEGVRELCRVVDQLPVTGQRCLLNLKLGNRHRAHLAAAAPDLARAFDRFVLGCDIHYVHQAKDYAGDDPVGAMLDASRATLQAHGVAAERMLSEPLAEKALERALAQAAPGDLLVLLAEPWVAMQAVAAWRERMGGSAA